MEMLQSAFDSVSTVSSYILVAVLIPTGLYFTIRTGAVQVRLLPEIIAEVEGFVAADDPRLKTLRADLLGAYAEPEIPS